MRQLVNRKTKRPVVFNQLTAFCKPLTEIRTRIRLIATLVLEFRVQT